MMRNRLADALGGQLQAGVPVFRHRPATPEYYIPDTLIDDLMEELREANERIAALEAANEALRVNVSPISEHVSENVLSNLRTEADLRAWVQHLIDERGKSGWRNKSEPDEPEGHPI